MEAFSQLWFSFPDDASMFQSDRKQTVTGPEAECSISRMKCQKSGKDRVGVYFSTWGPNVPMLIAIIRAGLSKWRAIVVPLQPSLERLMPAVQSYGSTY